MLEINFLSNKSKQPMAQAFLYKLGSKKSVIRGQFSEIAAFKYEMKMKP